MLNIYRFILLRFPPYQLLPLSLLFGLSCTHPLSLTGWGITAFALLCYLFELRIFDEFKDYKHDSLYYPDRPIQKGIITLHELKHIGAINLLMQVILVIAFRPNIYLFFVVQCYTLLMSREFFIKKWLDTHFTLNILMHEIVTPFLFLYLMSYTSLEMTSVSILYAIFLGINLFFLELGRKLKPRENAQHANDTYIERYSTRGIAILCLVLICISTILYGIFLQNPLYYIPLFCFLPFFAIILYKYTNSGWLQYADALFISLIVLVFINLLTVTSARMW